MTSPESEPSGCPAASRIPRLQPYPTPASFAPPIVRILRHHPPSLSAHTIPRFTRGSACVRALGTELVPA